MPGQSGKSPAVLTPEGRRNGAAAPASIEDVVNAAEREAKNTQDRLDPARFDAVCQIGNRTYELRDVPIARFKRAKALFISDMETFARFVVGANPTQSDAMSAIWTMIEDQPAEFLHILVPDLDMNTFEDEDTGVTIPQMKHALEVAMEVNGLSFLKKALPFILETARMGVIRTERAALERQIAEGEKALAEAEAMTKANSSDSSSSTAVTPTLTSTTTTED